MQWGGDDTNDIQFFSIFNIYTNRTLALDPLIMLTLGRKMMSDQSKGATKFHFDKPVYFIVVTCRSISKGLHSEAQMTQRLLC